MKAIKKVTSWIRTHIKTTILTILILLGAVYGGMRVFGSTATVTRYMVATVERGDIVTAVTGTGQVISSDSLDIASEVSGDVTYQAATLGQSVNRGTLLVTVKSDDASRSVSNAELSLENAKIAYEKAQNKSKEQAHTSSISDLKEAYKKGYAAVSKVYIDLPDVILDVDAIYYDPEHSPYFNDLEVRSVGGDTALKYKYDAGVIFDSSKKDYDRNFSSYRSASESSGDTVIDALLEQTSTMVKKLQTALTGAYNTLDYINARTSDTPSELLEDKSTLNSDINSLNSHITALESVIDAIQEAGDSSVNAELDLKSAELGVRQAEASLKAAQENLADHSIRAPFDGIVSKVIVKAGDKISSGTKVVSLITAEKVAELSLNEVDAAKVKVGQSATLTFDALEDFEITGKVSEVDVVGTVSQGVVSYTVKIAFDRADDSIKPGMTVSAEIQANKTEAVLRVPVVAIKTVGGRSFIEVPIEVIASSTRRGPITLVNPPTQISVMTGISNDDFIEIVSGLEEGQVYIARTIVATGAQAPTAGAPSLFGGNAGFGGTRTFRATTGSAVPTDGKQIINIQRVP